MRVLRLSLYLWPCATVSASASPKTCSTALNGVAPAVMVLAVRDDGCGPLYDSLAAARALCDGKRTRAGQALQVCERKPLSYPSPQCEPPRTHTHDVHDTMCMSKYARGVGVDRLCRIGCITALTGVC